VGVDWVGVVVIVRGGVRAGVGRKLLFLITVNMLPPSSVSDTAKKCLC